MENTTIKTTDKLTAVMMRGFFISELVSEGAGGWLIVLFAMFLH